MEKFLNEDIFGDQHRIDRIMVRPKAVQSFIEKSKNLNDSGEN